MLVKLKRGAPTGEWLDPSLEHVVLSIDVSSHGTQYPVYSESEGIPILVPADALEIIDARVSERWIVSAVLKSLFIEPAAWSRSGFWEEFFEGNADAQRAFDNERRLLTSDPWTSRPAQRSD